MSDHASVRLHADEWIVVVEALANLYEMIQEEVESAAPSDLPDLVAEGQRVYDLTLRIKNDEQVVAAIAATGDGV